MEAIGIDSRIGDEQTHCCVNKDGASIGCLSCDVTIEGPFSLTVGMSLTGGGNPTIIALMWLVRLSYSFLLALALLSSHPLLPLVLCPVGACYCVLFWRSLV